jgi:hypothetical protein
MADLPGEGEESRLGDVKGQFAPGDGGVEAHDPGGGSLIDAAIIGHDDDFFPRLEGFESGAERAGMGAVPGKEMDREIEGLFFEPMAAVLTEAAVGIVENVK